MATILLRRKSVRQIWIALIILTVVGCAALVYASLRYGDHHFSEKWKRGNFPKTQGKLTEKCISVCDSEECVQESNLLLNQVNPSINPCQNFFEFACGKYLEKFDKDDSRTVQNRMKEQLKLRIRDILENIEPDNNTASGKVKIVYNSCIERRSSDNKAVLTITEMLSQLGIPNWPNFDPSFKFQESSLPTVLSKFIAHEEYGFLYFTTMPAYPFEIANATILVVRGAYEKKRYMSKYLTEKALRYFNLDNENIVRIWNESEDIVNAVDHLKQESRRIVDYDAAYEEIVIDCSLECENEWKHVCKLLKSSIDVVGATTGISKRFLRLEGSKIHFVQNIFSVLRNFSDRSLANFLALNVLLNHLDDLNFYFRGLYQQELATIISVTMSYAEIDHWQHCTEWVMQKLFIPLGHEYMKSTLTQSDIDELDDLVREIFLVTAGEISRQNWTTEAVRKHMTTWTEYLVYSVPLLKDVLTNETFINDIFSQFHPKDGSFMYNVFEYQRYSKLLEMQGTTRGRIWFDSSILTSSAEHMGRRIDLEFGILMPPIYHPNIERIINTVTLSTIVVHEIGLILDDLHYRFQRQDEGLKNFTDVVKTCISNQYSEFKFKLIGKKVDGSRYVRKNFADLIAISIIDKFIEKYSMENEAFALPSFPYSTEQVLYLSSVQMFCSANSRRDEETYEMIRSHSLPRFRVLGMMQNSKGFAKAFNCPEGSYMNPSTKCSYFIN